MFLCVACPLMYVQLWCELYVCVNVHMHKYILHTIRHLLAVCVSMCARISTFSIHSVFMCVDECTSQCSYIIWLLP